MSHLLEIKDLQVRYHTEDGTVYALNHVDLELDDGETLGLVGETGAGKTTLAKSIMRLIPNPPGKIEGGTIEFDGKNLLHLSNAYLHLSAKGQPVLWTVGSGIRPSMGLKRRTFRCTWGMAPKSPSV